MTIKMERTPHGLLALNLQFFADDGDEGPQEEVLRGGYDPDTEIDFNPDATNPLAEQADGGGEPNPDEGQSVDPQAEGGQEQPNPGDESYLDFGGRKVDPSDPESVRGAQQDFLNAQRFITQQSQENQMLRQQLQMFQQGQNPNGQATQQAFPEQQQNQQQPEAEPELTPEELQDLFYDDPAKYHQELQRQITRQVEQKYEPVREQHEQMQRRDAFLQEYNNVAQKYGEDFDRHYDAIKDVAQQIGDEKAEQIGLEGLYFMARGRSQPEQRMPSPEQLVNDPRFIEQYVLNNEEVRNRLMSEYMQGKNQRRSPGTISNRQGGAPNLSQVPRPKTISEAGKLARQHFNQ